MSLQVNYPVVPDYIGKALLSYYEAEALLAKKRANKSSGGLTSRGASFHMGTETKVTISGSHQRLALQKESTTALWLKRREHHMRTGGDFLMAGRGSSSGSFGYRKSAIKDDVKFAGFPISQPSKREVWDARSQKLVLSSDKARSNSDIDADICFKHMGTVDKFFREHFSVRPVPSGLMKAHVHQKSAFNNAYWNSKENAIFFGETDPRVFRSFVSDLSISTHEWGHAVTQYSGGLVYTGQSGALNESISDVFAIMSLHCQAKIKADGPDTKWLIAEGLIVNSRSGNSLRSLSEPGTAYKGHKMIGSDPQPAHMRDYKKLPMDADHDWGGVHLNSGIPNRAFYLAAQKVGGYSWECIGKIWHQALKTADPTDDFSAFAGRTLAACHTLHKQHIYSIVGDAWRDVGVDLRGIKAVSTSSSGGDPFYATTSKGILSFLRDNPFLMFAGAFVIGGIVGCFHNSVRKRLAAKRIC